MVSVMTHSKHSINERTRYCPVCNADWQSTPIPEKYRQNYAPDVTHFSRLIGVEIREKYDGVDHWLCPDCRSTFKRR